MLFRILTLLLMLFAGLFFLTDQQRPVRPEKITGFSETILLELMESRASSIRDKDTRVWKGLFSKDLEVVFINSDDSRYYKGVREMNDLIDVFSKYGRTYETELLSEVMLISEDRSKALIERTSKENWLFHEKFDDVWLELAETVEWRLENNVPQIIRLVKTYSSMTALNQQVGKKHNLFFKSG